MAIELTREQARRVAVAAQLLARPRPTDLLEIVRHLTTLRADATAAVAPAADLMAWSRLGDDDDSRDLEFALERHDLIELDGFLRPAEDLALFLDEMHQWPERESTRDWLDVNQEFRRDVLDRIRDEGPLSAKQLPDTSLVSWPSSGWNNNRNVTMMLECLHRAGELAVVGREGHLRVWDLAENVYRADLPHIPRAEATRMLDERRLRALGIVRDKALVTPTEQFDPREHGEAATVEGTRGAWRVDLEALAASERFEGRTALLSPFDRLSFDRARTEELFEYEYALEMYKPAAKRRWGYFALPVLHGDRLIGKLDATSDRLRGRFTVHAVHEDEHWPAEVRAAVHGEIEALARWLELGVEGL